MTKINAIVAAVAAAFALTFTATPAGAQNTSEWMSLASDDKIDWAAQSKTLKYVMVDGVEYLTVTGRVISKGSNTTLFYNWLVGTAQCPAKQGMVIVLPVHNGKSYTTSFVFNGGTPGSRIAEYLCKAHDQVDKVEAEKKAREDIQAVKS
jgi:hypothetical protein